MGPSVRIRDAKALWHNRFVKDISARNVGNCRVSGTGAAQGEQA